MLYHVLSIILLCLPLLFLFGLLPQCSTFILCILENFDMHLFGGTAMVNIPGALYSCSLSIVHFLLLSVIGYYGLLIHTSKVKNFIRDQEEFALRFRIGSYSEYLVFHLLWFDSEYLL